MNVRKFGRTSVKNSFSQIMPPDGTAGKGCHVDLIPPTLLQPGHPRQTLVRSEVPVEFGMLWCSVVHCLPKWLESTAASGSKQE